MDSGMLWFDDRKNVSVIEKIAAAVKYYEQKYGNKPACCYVHSEVELDDLETDDIDLRIETSNYVLPNHYLIEMN